MSKSKTKYVKLYQVNNWMSISYQYGDTAIKLTEGSSVNIEWPDGQLDKMVLSKKTYHTTVSDMGHEYPVVQEFFGFFVRIHGVSAWVDLADVKVDKDCIDGTH